MHIVAIIPAKGNSYRLPQKNIVSVWGQPMIVWPIKACQESSHNIDVIVSTDSDKIATIARETGAYAHMRPKWLSEDDVPKQQVIRETVKNIYKHVSLPDIIISLQANSPEVTAEDIDYGIDLLLNNNCSEVFSVGEDSVQNAAFRIFRGDHVFWKDLSVHCGIVICDILDVHTELDVIELERRGCPHREEED